MVNAKGGTGTDGKVTDSGGNAFVNNPATKKVTKNGSDTSFPDTPTEIFGKDAGKYVYAKTANGAWYLYSGSSWIVAPNHPRDM